MARAMISPKFYAWDRNGKPLAFGKVYTYQARTNTPKPTYHSEDQIVPNTNPVILSGEGYADIYLDGSYKIVVKDSNDNEIWTADPVTQGGGEGSDTYSQFTLTGYYSTPTKVEVLGDYTSAMREGVRITLTTLQDSGRDKEQPSTIVSSVFDGDKTAITITDPLVTPGVKSVSVTNWPFEEIGAIEEFVESNELTFQTPQGQTKETITGIERKVFNQVASVPLGDGQWAAGKVYEAYNEYLNYGGIAYKPAMDTPLPYTTQGPDPTDGPDAGNVVPFAEVTRSDVVLNVASISDLQALDTRALVDGQNANVKGTVFVWEGSQWNRKGLVDVNAYGAGGDSAVNEAHSDSPTGAYLTSQTINVSGDVEGVASLSNGGSINGGSSIRYTTDRVPDDEQTNFLEMLRSFKPIALQFRVDENTDVSVMCIYGNGRYVEHYFTALDGDYTTQSTSYTGTWGTDAVLESGVLADTGTYTGTWVESTSSINGYTSEVGATFTADITVSETGKDLLFRHTIRPDGDKLEAKVFIGSTFIASKVIDTYNDVSSKSVDVLLEDAEPATYTIKLTYIGSPSNRGWLNSTSQNVFLSAQPVYTKADYEFITTPSNKDFAIEVAPLENPTAFQFVPTHSGVQTDFEKFPRKWVLDGVEYSDSDLFPDLVVECKNFKLVQHIYFETPETTPSRELGEVVGIQEINEYGELVMTGYLKPNEPLVFGNGYTMMHVGHLETSNRYLTGVGSVVEMTSPSSGENHHLPYDADTTFNFCYVGQSTGSSVENICSAMRVFNPQATRRLGAPNKPPKKSMTYLQLRSSSIAKLYTNLFDKPYQGSDVVVWHGAYKYVNDDLLQVYMGALGQ